MPQGNQPLTLPESGFRFNNAVNSMRPDLPGFYYDADRNRYFPIKPRIPGSTSVPSSSGPARIPVSEPTQEIKSCRKAALRTAKLLQARELHGKVISYRGKYDFKEEYQKIQAARPVVWKYNETEKISDGALENILIDVQTPEGQTETVVLLTGGKNGYLSFFGVGKLSQHIDSGVKCMPDIVWRPTGVNQSSCRKQSAEIWSLPGETFQMSSNISNINLFPGHGPCGLDYVSNVRHALISTLGSESCGGSLYAINLAAPLDFDPMSPLIRHRLDKVSSFNCTVWTFDCKRNGDRAVIGTSLGAASVDLGTGRASWMLHSKSDVFAQQIIHSGNVVLCGLRNGMIVTVDARERRREISTRLVRHRIPIATNRGVETSKKQWFKLTGNICPSGTVTMPSSISSLLSLQSDDQYFLASSMDGSVLFVLTLSRGLDIVQSLSFYYDVRLYDHRLIQRGPVQSYEGLVNSHTRVQLGVDPFERYVASGGEDCTVLVWSVKSGELLFREKFADSVPTTFRWQRAGRSTMAPEEFQLYRKCVHHEEYSLGAWVGSEEGIYYMHWPMT